MILVQRKQVIRHLTSVCSFNNVLKKDIHLDSKPAMRFPLNCTNNINIFFPSNDSTCKLLYIIQNDRIDLSNRFFQLLLLK